MDLKSRMKNARDKIVKNFFAFIIRFFNLEFWLREEKLQASDE